MNPDRSPHCTRGRQPHLSEQAGEGRELSGAGDHRQLATVLGGSEPVEFSKIHLEPLSNGAAFNNLGKTDEYRVVLPTCRLD